MKRIGILGGTFDPPHLGHMIMAEASREQMKLDEVWFIPSHLPPHKQAAEVGALDRLKMVKQAVKSNQRFYVNDLELNREGKSYTIDTIQQLRLENPETEFYFIIGGDMVEYLPNWHRIDELVKLVQFVGVKRPGFEWDHQYDVHEVDIPLIEISSSEIRLRLAEQKTIRYLVPETVYEYIKEHRLYEA
ncbi:nicotinate-nucleotide adenylyltransferase [Halobacillus salinarum]|uniref:Probable nicotinate-nucleotide adenylyltransferase n=1 Tax=Halobacillus salinarum TaxID=2932257 RepID=A0ABY4EQ63_9BACI|nr:nicotinate-nucleotide adenylyltransferase [Halobacillus salinarum]UOQ46318.1 nicotinate-nucleotide adenylyltransferase [Halobacillus salinarum]